MDNLCIYALGVLFILFLISENNSPNIFSDFLFTDLGLISALVIIILLCNMNNSIILVIGLFVLLLLLSKTTILSAHNKQEYFKEINKPVQNYESQAFDSCRSTLNCSDRDNLELVSVQSMLPYVNDEIVESKPSWKPVLCKPIVS